MPWNVFVNKLLVDHFPCFAHVNNVFFTCTIFLVSSFLNRHFADNVMKVIGVLLVALHFVVTVSGGWHVTWSMRDSIIWVPEALTLFSSFFLSFIACFPSFFLSFFLFRSSLFLGMNRSLHWLLFLFYFAGIGSLGKRHYFLSELDCR